ncbi:MAG: cardiolipin synthase [Sphingomicrobium sp.]
MDSVSLPNLETVYLVCDWTIRIAMLLVIPLRRPPEATRSWLLLVFFLPLAGLLLFLAIGRTRFPAWRRARFASLSPFLTQVSAKFAARSAATAGLPQPAQDLVKTLGGWPAAGGNSVIFLDEYDEVTDRLVADIDGAKRNVRLLAYILADDATGRRVIEALGRAVERGVSCHVLVDPVGSHHWIRNTLKLLWQYGVETRQTLPWRWLRGRTRRDMRNHRKLFMIDGSIGYAGSQNIVDKDFRPGVVNRELVLRVTGQVVAQMDALFVSDWFLETETMLPTAPELPAATGSAIAQLLPSGPDYGIPGFETFLVSQFHAARDRVMITTPYLIPDEGLLGAMRTAGLRGVEIDLIVSAVVDQRLVNLAQRSFYDELLVVGARIHRYADFLLHAKSVSIDGTLGIVGSSNVDIRSFQLNEEASVILYDPPSVAALESIQRRYIEHSAALDLETWRGRSPLAKVAENLARLVTPLL